MRIFYVEIAISNDGGEEGSTYRYMGNIPFLIQRGNTIIEAAAWSPIKLKKLKEIKFSIWSISTYVFAFNLSIDHSTVQFAEQNMLCLYDEFS